MSEKRRCKGIKEDGERCGVTGGFVDKDSGYCPAHDPEKPDEMARRGSKGGQRSAEKRKMDGFTLEELAPLETYEDVERRLDLVVTAVLIGKIDDRTANAAIRGCKEWTATRSERQANEELEALQTRIDEVESELLEGSAGWQ